MGWPLDTPAPVVAAARAVAEERRRRGLRPEQHALPKLMVATFQGAAYARPRGRAGVDPSRSRGAGPPGGIAARGATRSAPAAGSPCG